MHRPYQDEPRPITSFDSLDEVDTVARFQGDVGDNEVPKPSQRIGYVFRLPAYFQVGLLGDARNQRLTNRGMVVHNQDLQAAS